MNEINQDTTQAAAVFKSIAVFGAGSGLGQAVARRYTQEGYTVILVARHRESLDLLARDLASAGATAHVITADLSDTDAVPALDARDCASRVSHFQAFSGFEFSLPLNRVHTCAELVESPAHLMCWLLGSSTRILKVLAGITPHDMP
jgi:NAD(P)-dependent dehydrogenase (short-subunit alcohol dehydrogenase family)